MAAAWGAQGHVPSGIGYAAIHSLHKDNMMNKLLAALVATVFSAGAFAQASAPAQAPAPAAAAPAPAASAPAAGEKAMQHHKKKKKRDHRPKHQDKSAYGVGG